MIKIENDISYYITGLWEGEGHIVAMSEKTKSFTFAITFNKNNEKLANYLSTYVGYGYLRKKIKENTLVLTIGNKKGLLRIAKLLNGKLRTPKIDKFNKLIDWLNTKYPEGNIMKHNADKSDLFSNSWFAGFTEADGSFDIRVTQSSKKSRIALRWRLDQRMHDPITSKSYNECLLVISETFNVKLTIIERKDRSYYHISITSANGLNKLIEYFNIYPLLGVKFLDYSDWLSAYNIYKNRNKITPDLIIELKKIKNKMNSRRVHFLLPHFE
jgi:hypothetical protein